MTANKVYSFLFLLSHLGWESSLHFPAHFAFSTPTLKTSSISKQQVVLGSCTTFRSFLPNHPCWSLLAYYPWARQDPTNQVGFLKIFQFISGGWERKLISFTISILNPDLSLLTSSEINPQTKAVDHTVWSSSSQMKDGSTLRKSFYFGFYNFSLIVSILLLSEVQILFTQMEVRQDCLWPALSPFLRSWHYCCLYVK